MNRKRKHRHKQVRVARPGKRTRSIQKRSITSTAAEHPFRRHPVLGFLLVFGLLAGLFYAITFFSPFYRDRVFPLVLRLTARLSGVALRLLDQRITVIDASILSRMFSVQIVRGCDAIEPVALFACAVLAFPSPWTRKVLGIMTGTLLLVVLNQVRIVTLFLIGVHVPSLFGVMHVDVWQGVFIVLALVLWLLWLLWVTQRPIPATQRAT